MKKQFVQLCDLLCHCQKNISAFSEILNGRQIEVSNVEEIWREIPITHKSDIIADIRRYVSKQLSNELLNQILDSKKNIMIESTFLSPHKNEKYFVEYTTGSSGYPLISIKSENERVALGMNTWKLRKEIDNINPREMFAFIHNYTGEKLQKEKKLIDLLEYLRTEKYYWWHINQEKLANIARIVANKRIHFQFLRVIENNGSYMGESERKEYEKLFDCKVVDNYGCREVWTIAYSCKCNHLHINTDHIIFELYDENDNLIEDYDREGRVVVTSLLQKNMPFVKYDTGDRAIYKRDGCKYNSSPIIELRPTRTCIVGQDRIEGNKLFRNVVKKMNYKYGVYDFDSIKVVQVSEYEFRVFLKGNREEKSDIELAFQKSINGLLDIERYSFTFVYNQDTIYKNLFQIDSEFNLQIKKQT